MEQGIAQLASGMRLLDFFPLDCFVSYTDIEPIPPSFYKNISNCSMIYLNILPLFTFIIVVLFFLKIKNKFLYSHYDGIAFLISFSPIKCFHTLSHLTPTMFTK